MGELDHVVQCSGRASKLNQNNPGLIAATAALNSGVSPKQVAITCNTYNARREINVTIS